jgi:tetratricopeptide (TPR) repeat protein
MSFWSRIKDALTPSKPELPDVDAPAPTDEQALRALLQKLGEGDQAAVARIGDRDFFGAISRLQAAGRERTAIDLLGRFAAARPQDLEITSRLAELLADRREDEVARPLLERLLSSAAHALRAHFLLAELAERRGDEDAARRHLETVLASDLDYPKARTLADRMRRAPAQAAAPAAAPTLAGLPESGTEFAGRYRLLRELGRGGSGAVYVARDEELGRDLAIKILHPHTRAAARAEARARAWVEARVAASIRHPGVVAIYDLDEERQLLAMELCTGGALKERLSSGPLSPAEALSRGAELLRTLAAVHLRGVAHGDVKPGNLLFRSAGGDLVLGDFGVARLIGDKPTVDDRGARGTLAYMSPEQRKGELTPPADVYAAGVILVELLSGTSRLQPWLGDRHALLRGVARWDGKLPPDVESYLVGRGGELRALIAAMLSEAPTSRPDAESAARALAVFT